MMDGPRAPLLVGPLRTILSEVAFKHGVDIDRLLSRSHAPDLARCRQEYCYRALAETTRDLRMIGRIIRRDHSMVVWSAGVFARDHGLPFARGRDITHWKHWQGRNRAWSHTAHQPELALPNAVGMT